MADRLNELVLGLQRMAENVKLRGDDLRYNQAQETYDHVSAIDQLLGMVEKVRQSLLDERSRSLPAEPQVPEAKMPRIVKQGPAA